MRAAHHLSGGAPAAGSRRAAQRPGCLKRQGRAARSRERLWRAWQALVPQLWLMPPRSASRRHQRSALPSQVFQLTSGAATRRQVCLTRGRKQLPTGSPALLHLLLHLLVPFCLASRRQG